MFVIAAVSDAPAPFRAGIRQSAAFVLLGITVGVAANMLALCAAAATVLYFSDAGVANDYGNGSAGGACLVLHGGVFAVYDRAAGDLRQSSVLLGKPFALF